jgi:ABC-2 type transport system permease protein
MLHDIRTMIQKEFKEITHQRGSKTTGWLTILTSIGLLGIYMPWMTGRDWVLNPAGPLSFSWMPLFLAMGIIADSFAGERERYTLETLLASRLSDQAILFGKLITAVCYSSSIAITGLLLGGVVINLSAPQAEFIFYAPGMLLCLILFEVLASALIAALGVIVSLHADSVRQAYQRLSFGMMGAGLGLYIFFQFLPQSWKTSMDGILTSINPAVLVPVLFAGMAVVTVALLFGAIARFQRARLILD